MKKHFWILLVVLLLGVRLLLGVSAAQAQERAFTHTWSVMGSGGMGTSNGTYTIHSTLGQPVAGVADESPLHLTSGFWGEAWQIVKELFYYLPLILR